VTRDVLNGDLPLFVMDRRTDMSFEPCFLDFEARSLRSGDSGGVGGWLTNARTWRCNGPPSS
jgi:hypothetical protein